eukprot:CAMPEP_0174251872 /NCGR_PEP_ID=MMETSP0439-20130205/1563_1 /TAXON_ID=0 /ORGANISM="Stereomyxa ramosa, Strain Chinc5" /LENGTH=807 /DNA_ID=CAMNT_0015332309 /DNA_START=23 /DNA_END=2442 /DNA_ORIENTATION=+
MPTKKKNRGKRPPIPPQKPSAFATRSIRAKHKVLGKETKGVERTIAKKPISDDRKNILLKEYKQRNKSNSFRDKRFGEHDHSLTREEKMIARFQKEREARFKKGDLYKLGEEEELTHFGASLSTIDDFSEDIYFSSDEEEGQLGADIVEQTHFGGFVRKEEDGEQKQEKKTRAEIMQEIITKSKFYKAERQRQKDEAIELREKLDEDWDSIKSSFLSSNPKKSETSSKDEFSALYHELALEAKAKATDRLKTPEELARDQKNKLEKLEESRIARMSSEYEKDGEVETRATEVIESGDALCGDFALDSSSDDEDEDEDQEDGGDAPLNLNSNNLLQESRFQLNSQSSSLTSSSTPDISVEDIPFTFEMPKNYASFRKLLSQYPSAYLPIIIHRICVCHRASLAPENKAKMQTFYGILFTHFTHIANARPVEVVLLDNLTGYLFALAQEMPDVAIHFSKSYLEKLLASISTTGIRTKWPKTSELMNLRLFSVLFPTTDYQHNIITPALLFMSCCLCHCLITHTRDLISSLFVVTSILHYRLESNKYSPEIVNFLNSLLFLAVSSNTKSSKGKQELDKQFTFLNKHTLSNTECLSVNKNEYKEKKEDENNDNDVFFPLPLLKLLALPPTDPLFSSTNLRVAIIETVVKILRTVVSNYFSNTGILCYPELFFPTYKLVCYLIDLDVIPTKSPCKEMAVELRDHLKVCIERKLTSRQPLHQRKNVIALKTYNPRFQERYKVGKDHDPDKERAEKKRLKRKYKEEMKGAMRELRKDNYFLQDQRAKKRAKKMEERDRKTQEIMAFLGNQEGEL